LRVLSFFYVKHWGFFFGLLSLSFQNFFGPSTYPFPAISFHFLVGLKVLCSFFVYIRLHYM
jgi:hypothetical protein